MYINDRVKSHELLFYEALAVRAKLTKNEEGKFKRLKRGFDGENLYDDIFDEVGHNDVYIYRDVYLKIEDSVTQYDSLIINDEGIVVNEIKNFSGHCKLEQGGWYNGTFPIPDNPLNQSGRAVSKLIKWKNSSHATFNVSGKIIFPNDNFTLHSDDQNIWDKVILRPGLRNYFRHFYNSRTGNKAKYIAKLISSCIVENPYFKGDVDSSRLKLGLYCGKCGSFNLTKSRFHLICNKCSSKECNETHLLRTLNDYKFLFYNQPLTRNSFLTFIDHELHPRTVSRILLKHCYFNKKGNQSNYLFKYFDFEDALRKSDVYLRYKDYIR